MEVGNLVGVWIEEHGNADPVGLGVAQRRDHEPLPVAFLPARHSASKHEPEWPL